MLISHNYLSKLIWWTLYLKQEKSMLGKPVLACHKMTGDSLLSTEPASKPYHGTYVLIMMLLLLLSCLLVISDMIKLFPRPEYTICLPTQWQREHWSCQISSSSYCQYASTLRNKIQQMSRPLDCCFKIQIRYKAWLPQQLLLKQETVYVVTMVATFSPRSYMIGW